MDAHANDCVQDGAELWSSHVFEPVIAVEKNTVAVLARETCGVEGMVFGTKDHGLDGALEMETSTIGAGSRGTVSRVMVVEIAQT
jgi:hypothetical protein